MTILILPIIHRARGCVRNRWAARLLVVLWAAFGLLPAGSHAAETAAPLTFALFPYRAPQWLAATFAPLRDYLQQSAGRNVELISAPDYETYRRRMLAGDYDIIFVPPHFGRLAEQQVQYQRIAMTGYRIYGVIVVGNDSTIRQVSDLRGRRVAVPPPTAITYVLATDLLREHGLDPARDVILREYENNQNSLAAPLRGDADAAMTGILLWQREGDHRNLRVLAQTRAVPGFTLLAHPRLSAEMVARLRRVIDEFGNTPGGVAYFAETGHVSWRPVDDEAMRSLDAMVRRIAE